MKIREYFANLDTDELESIKEKVEKYDAFSTVGIVKDKIKLREENKQLKEAFNISEKDYEILKQERKLLVKQIHDLEEAMDYEPDLLERLELTKENKQLKENARKVKKRHDDICSKLDTLSDKYQNLKEIVEKIKKRIEYVKTKDNALNDPSYTGWKDELEILEELLATKEEK